IDCVSEVGEGTTLKLYFPASKSLEKRPKNGMQLQEESLLSGSETVLVVEDDMQILDLWNHILPNYGYKVIPAADGENAIRVYAKNNIDVIILDLEMPGMGGIKCLEKLLTINRDARVIISSGYSLNGSVKKAMNSGAMAFLSKPVGINDLLKTVRHVVEHN
ncbi:MAG: response regulator, partial [Deltaproteobacteria bacterium]|nr:response regulator [Deltaproteobacteria bacterium]